MYKQGVFWQRCLINNLHWEKRNLQHCWWECKLVQPLWKTVWMSLKKLKIELPYDPAIPLISISIYPEKKKTLIRKDTCTPMYTAALFATAKTWKQPKFPSTDDQLKKMWWASLVAQWLRIRLPTQGTRVRALVQEDPICGGATKPVRHNYWACKSQLLKSVCLEPVLCQQEACALQQRVAPAYRS